MTRPRAEIGKRVVGIGGIFIRAKKADRLSKWYSKHLGISIIENVAIFTWLNPNHPKQKGHTVWSIFPQNTSYFGRKGNQFMVNYRVRNLKSLLARLRREGVKVARKVEESKYGKFGWVTDPEGNRIELWEPPRGYRGPEKETPME
jgi:predicted enzyme related to lactoylglutathione lyase